VALAATGTYSFVLTYLIAKGIDKTIGFRTAEEYENVPGGKFAEAYDDLRGERVE
jgi:Amt family ammonium transporter